MAQPMLFHRNAHQVIFVPNDQVWVKEEN